MHRCELCYLISEEVVLVYHHTLCLSCLEKVIEKGREVSADEVQERND